MSEWNGIKVESVNKSFKLPHEKQGSIKNVFLNAFNGSRTFEKQVVLEDVTFEVKNGEFFGIVGRNGSGKSTLLKLLAGIYSPDSGDIQVNGKLTPFIELGVGFSPELTGRENIFLNGALLGFNRPEMEAMYKEIVEFAELEKFMDQKLKNYSSGMQVRLAFSIAIRVNTEILLLDEVLAVGDTAFQRKCFDYFMLLKKNKKTVILVTHDMGAVRQYCDRAIMIEKGKIVHSGEPEKVAQFYQRLFTEESKKQSEGRKISKGKEDRWGEGGLKAHKTQTTVTPKTVTLSTEYRASKNIPPPIYGFTIYGPNGLNIVENNTLRVKRKTETVENGDVVNIVWEIPNIFAAGNYNVSVACCDQSTTRFYDWLNEASSFSISREENTAGSVYPQMSIVSYLKSKQDSHVEKN